MAKKMIREFFKLEASAGILLGMTAILALIIKNSPLESVYDSFLTTKVTFGIGSFLIDKALLLWINDGLMAVFFMLVGLEIKREIMVGQLATRAQFSLPAIAALGGLILPAIIYYYINMGDAVAVNGWAIPAATDIAFALGIVMLLGKRVPESLKICLVAVAIIDDLAAIAIIALFYTENLSLMSLGLGGICVAVLAIFNQRGITKIAPYVLVGIVFWACVLKSGVHATLAGVILALFIPLKIENKKGKKPLIELEHSLHPYVAYMVIPVFAFANAGVSLKGLTMEMMLQPITLGIAAGLFFGKQIGIMGFTFIGKMTGLCVLPKGVNWLQYYGMALVCGVGFTMSLFIGTLAFKDPELQTAVRLGVLSGSLISGIAGYLVLQYSGRNLVSPKQED